MRPLGSTVLTTIIAATRVVRMSVVMDQRMTLQHECLAGRQLGLIRERLADREEHQIGEIRTLQRMRLNRRAAEWRIRQRITVSAIALGWSPTGIGR